MPTLSARPPIDLHPSTARSVRSRWALRRLTIALLFTAIATLVVPVAGAEASVVTSQDLLAQWGQTGTTVVQDGSSWITYRGTWRVQVHAGYMDNRVRYTNERWASASITFDGNGIAWIGPKSTTRGKASVYVDGRFVTSVNLWASRFQADRVLFTRTWSSTGRHTLKVVALGTTGHPTVAIDAFIVRGTAGCSTLQARIDGAAAGSVLDLSGCTYTAGAKVNKALTLRGATIRPPTGTKGILVTADNVTLDGLTIIGPQGKTFNWTDYGVYAAGTASNSVANLVVKNSTISRFGYGGISGHYVSAMVIANNRVSDCVYTGIMVHSGTGGRITGNVVERIGVYGASANSNNAYGITLTHSSGAPRTSNFVVSGNTVVDVPTWHAIDTHGGSHVQITKNTVRRTYRAIFLTTGAGGERPTDITASGNLLESPSTFSVGPRAVTTVSSVDVTITYNTAKGWGSEGFFTDYKNQSTGLVVANNSVTP